ncbi:MAG: GNAT family N-acetyltransferase [Anaerolineales bacterium]
MIRSPSALTETITIRPARAEDLPGLEWDDEFAHYRSLYRRVFEETQQGQRMMLVAAAGEMIVGQVFVQLLSAEREFADGVSRGYLYSLRVRPAWQGQGIGTRLISAAEKELHARGFTTAVIAAGKSNEGAFKLYQRLGYRVFAEDPGVWYFTDVNGVRQNVEEPCWVMEKSLK